MYIHPEAIVHPTAVLEGEVTIGARTRIGALCYIKGPIDIGTDNIIHPHCVFGEPAEHRAKQTNTPIHIGNNNVIRELTVVQRGTGDRETTIGSNCFIMDHCHIPHDCLLEDGITMAPNIVLAGHTVVLKGANLGMGVLTHQFSTVGSYAMLGMGAVVTKDIPPFALVMGNPARFKRFNTHQFKNLGVKEEEVAIVDGAISTKNAIVLDALAAFAAKVRRQILRLDTIE